jgi:CubicO group peptidase (beta-lactamase class C family)
MAGVWCGAGSAEGLNLQAEVGPLVQPLIDEGHIVGCVVGIVRDGQTQVLAYGETTKGSGEAPNGKTVYEIGSASKAFTGVMLADMVNDELVALDDPLKKYTPDNVKVPAKGKPITLEHLATHTSGLPRLSDNMPFKDPQNPYADYTAKMLYEFLGKHELRRAPGEYEYSNYGMGLLGQVLAKRERTTYERLLIKRIAKPLAMQDTCIKLSKDQRQRLAPPYDTALQPVKNWDFPTLAGCGGIRSTADDMLKFVQVGIAEDEAPVTQAMKLAFKKRHTMKDGLAIGLGWHIARDGITWWHNGMTGGYSAWISAVPDRKAAVVVLSNAATGKTTELGEKLTLVACGVKVEPPRTRKEVEVDADVLKPYAGNYAITPQFVLTVSVEDGKLFVQATNRPKFPVFAKSKTEFFYRVVDAQVTFVKDKEGNVTKLILHQNGIDQMAKRTD